MVGILATVSLMGNLLLIYGLHHCFHLRRFKGSNFRTWHVPRALAGFGDIGQYPTTIVEESKFSSNAVTAANSLGSLFYVDDSPRTFLHRNTFYNNKATIGGSLYPQFFFSRNEVQYISLKQRRTVWWGYVHTWLSFQIFLTTHSLATLP
jgi:hypothetical protein